MRAYTVCLIYGLQSAIPSKQAQYWLQSVVSAALIRNHQTKMATPARVIKPKITYKLIAENSS